MSPPPDWSTAPACVAVLRAGHMALALTAGARDTEVRRVHREICWVVDRIDGEPMPASAVELVRDLEAWRDAGLQPGDRYAERVQAATARLLQEYTAWWESHKGALEDVVRQTAASPVPQAPLTRDERNPRCHRQERSTLREAELAIQRAHERRAGRIASSRERETDPELLRLEALEVELRRFRMQRMGRAL